MINSSAGVYFIGLPKLNQRCLYFKAKLGAFLQNQENLEKPLHIQENELSLFLSNIKFGEFNFLRQ